MAKNAPANAGEVGDVGLTPGLEVTWGRARQPTPVSLPGESHGQRSLAGYGPWGRKEADTTEVTQQACIFNILNTHTECIYLIHVIFNIYIQYALNMMLIV